MTERAFAIGPPFSIHLEQAEIHPKLDLLLAVFRLKAADDNLAGLVFPGLQEMANIEIHEANMAGLAEQVNAGGPAR